VWRNVVPTFVYKAIRQEPLPIESGGVATRDFIYVGDVVRGLILSALLGRPGEAYNLASGIETSIRQLAELINELAANRAPLALAPARDWDRSGHRYGSPDKAREALGFAAEVPLREGLNRTIAWTRSNLSWIERCVGRHRDHAAAACREHC
jgi:nucleoside-diphosphate-sugar epimerase